VVAILVLRAGREGRMADDDPQSFGIDSVTVASPELAVSDALVRGTVHPDYTDGHATLAFIASYSAEFDQALEALARARQINPQGTGIYLAVEGRVLFMMKRYAEALLLLQESVDRNPGFDRTHLHLAAIYAELGQLDDAAWEVEEALAISPDITIEQERRDTLYMRDADIEHYLGALRKAGVPE
jgi:tetratricopeptide (TPR) repeat protein